MRKLQMSEKDWKDAWENCTAHYSREDIEKLTRIAGHKIRNVYDKFTVIGYSGGKDSIVLADICKKYLENPFFLNCKYQNEYPSLRKYIDVYGPSNMATTYSKKMPIEFFNSHPESLFPTTKEGRKVYSGFTKDAVDNWLIQNNKYCIICGKRVDDGNNVGRENCYGVNTTSRQLRGHTMYTYNVIADWTQEQLFAYIKYNNLSLPKIYQYPNGFTRGTEPWTERVLIDNSIKKTFDFLIENEPEIYEQVKGRLKIFDDYIKGVVK